MKKVVRSLTAFGLIVASLGICGCKGPKSEDGKCVKMPAITWYPMSKVDFHDVCPGR